jgi:hypothetical protein
MPERDWDKDLRKLEAENARLRQLLAMWLEAEAVMDDGPRFHRLVAEFGRRVRMELGRDANVAEAGR